jgi:hypothetical protein
MFPLEEIVPEEVLMGEMQGVEILELPLKSFSNIEKPKLPNLLPISKS